MEGGLKNGNLQAAQSMVGMQNKKRNLKGFDMSDTEFAGVK